MSTESTEDAGAIMHRLAGYALGARHRKPFPKGGVRFKEGEFTVVGWWENNIFYIGCGKNLTEREENDVQRTNL